MTWRLIPTKIDSWDISKYDNFIFIDERGTSDVKFLKKNPELGISDLNLRYLTLCACIVNKTNFLTIRDQILKIKNKHWPPSGNYNYKTYRKKEKIYEINNKTVVFHNSEINEKKGPFYEKIINYNIFKEDLESFLVSSNYTIIAVTIDKYELLQRECHHQNIDPYHVAYEMLNERIGFHLNEINQTAAIMNEARGEKENKSLLKFINNLYDMGNLHVQANEFSKIKGVYFNSKRNENEQKSFFGLEIVDLILPSISKFLISDREDKIFSKIKHKIRKYPNHLGKGIKFYPEKKK